MEARKNYYGWSVMVYCVLVLCTAAERVRHHHGKPEDDLYVSQLERAAAEDVPTPVVGCPNCIHKQKAEADSMRLEAIKRQILLKLGLRQKPKVTHSLPKEVIMQTLYRAEDNREFFRNLTKEEVTTSKRASSVEMVDADDFFGKTSEIISFAEEGKSSDICTP